VALKIYTRGEDDRNEFQIYKQLEEGSLSHPGREYVRKALDIFTIPRPGGDHSCIVQVPMWESFRDFLDRNPMRRFPERMLKIALMQVFAGLHYLHTQCKLVHTGKNRIWMALSERVILICVLIDINSANILHELKDESLFERFTQAEMQNPSRRKIVNDMPIYASRRFDMPGVHGHLVLGDLDSAVSGEKTWNHDMQPNVYRSPEVMLGTGWSYPIDIWNVGVMVCPRY
jgi:serine/threonine protein kinase